MAVLNQIRIAGQLTVALSGRQGTNLRTILQFIAQNMFHSAFFDVLYDVADVVLGKYTFVPSA